MLETSSTASRARAAPTRIILARRAAKADRPARRGLFARMRDAHIAPGRGDSSAPATASRRDARHPRLLPVLQSPTTCSSALLTGNFEEARASSSATSTCGTTSAAARSATMRRIASAGAVRRRSGADVRSRLGRYADVLVIGDTPHDVACAVAVGAHPLAVATGGFSVEQLRATGAPIVLEDLSDTASFLALLESGAREPQRQRADESCESRAGDGGSAWESNPAHPQSGQRPVLKTGRATGPRSLPY